MIRSGQCQPVPTVVMHMGVSSRLRTAVCMGAEQGDDKTSPTVACDGMHVLEGLDGGPERPGVRCFRSLRIGNAISSYASTMQSPYRQPDANQRKRPNARSGCLSEIGMLRGPFAGLERRTMPKHSQL